MLVNKTRCPDSLLLPIIEHAKRAIGVEGFVVVEIRQGRRQYVRGLAVCNDSIPCLGRYAHHIKVWLPQYRIDPLSGAYAVWEVLAHEFAHVLDYEAMGRGEERDFTYYRNNYNMRRMHHDSRPHEVRANNAVTEMRHRIARGELAGCDNDILELGCYLERH